MAADKTLISYYLIAILLSSIVLGSIVVAQMVTFNEEEEWIYTATFSDKTTGYQYNYMVYAYVEPYNDGFSLVYEFFEPGNETPSVIIDYTLTRELKISSILYVYPDNSTLEYVFNNPPPFIYYPQDAGDEYTHETSIGVYYNGEYYYSIGFRAVYQATGQVEIEFKNTNISTYEIVVVSEFIDDTTGQTMQSIDIYYVNESFKLPLLQIYEDNETKITFELVDYTLIPDPLSPGMDTGDTGGQAESPATNATLRLDYNMTGNYTASLPDALITIIGYTGEVARIEVAQLPVVIELEPGAYTIEVYPLNGTTVDGNGKFTFRGYTVNGSIVSEQILFTNIYNSTEITLNFNVYTVIEHQSQANTTSSQQAEEASNTTSNTNNNTGDTTNTTVNQEQETPDNTGNQEPGGQDNQDAASPVGTTQQPAYTAQGPLIEGTSNQAEGEDGGVGMLVLAGVLAAIGGSAVAYIMLNRRRTPGAQARLESIQPQVIVPVRQEPMPVDQGGGQARKQGIVCPNCGSINSARARFCRRCGTRLQ